MNLSTLVREDRAPDRDVRPLALEYSFAGKAWLVTPDVGGGVAGNTENDCPE